uniref:Double jelly roll-like domain-containing protein n=1 Tax=Anoplophora glabripennis TaxID=217634 RepID=V5I871_ANOGL
MKQELVLIRTNNDLDAISGADDTEKPKVTINKIFWRVPHVSVGIPQQLALTKILDKNTEILLPFRSWELIEYPSLSETTQHSWSVKTSNKLETPRHVVVAFQHNRKQKITSDMSWFDNINLTNIRVFLNSERYPYQDLYLNFKAKKLASLYEMFSNFRASYYETTKEPVYTPDEFSSICPIVHIDCSRQKETVQSGSVAMRIEFETSENVDKDTTAYCLILHDRLFRYNPLTKIVRQV